jgi:tryptophan synthase alpha chain
MSRINTAFSTKAKIAYLTAGDGGYNSNIEYFLALVAGGVNLLEVGIPYSDPVADGPVIQQAMQRALAQQTDVATSLAIVRAIRAQSQVAIILFTYYNPIQYDLVGFLQEAKAAGADGILIVDLPFEEAQTYRFWCQQLKLAPITVIAPSTRPARIAKLLYGLTDGFVYYACQKGTTGTRNELPEDVAAQVALIKQYTKLPVAVGFGVANRAMIQAIDAVADGSVVGSYLVKQVERGVSASELIQITKELFDVA